MLQFIEEGQVVPVVGQDLLTIPESTGHRTLYPYLGQRLATYLGIPGADLPDGAELNEVACRYMAKGKPVQKVYAALKTIASEAEQLPTPEPLRQLAAIRPFQLFITTTFDSFLVRALNEERFGGNPNTRVFGYAPNEVEDLSADLKSLDGPAVYHLLGKLSSTPAYAVTQEDLIEFFHSLQSDTHRPPLLFDELNRRNLLILGNRFSGWLNSFFMRMSKRQRLSADDKTDYVADSVVSGDPNLTLFLERFSSGTEIFREGGAVEFVAELYRRWMKIHPDTPSQGSIPQRGSLPIEAASGAVFLSYASADRPAVERIKIALEGSGIDVFFDREQLQAGNDWEAKLRRYIRQCSLFVPIISRQTLTPERRFFRVEWNLALEEAQRASFSDEAAFLLPVVIDDTSIDEPAIPARFRAIQWQSLPGGDPSAFFVSRVQQLYRKAQKERL